MLFSRWSIHNADVFIPQPEVIMIRSTSFGNSIVLTKRIRGSFGRTELYKVAIWFITRGMW